MVLKRILIERELAIIDSNWFKLFDYHIIEGSFEAFHHQLYSLALTEETALKYFGETHVIGKTVNIDSSTYTVTLILDNPPSNSSLRFNAFITVDSEWTDTDVYDSEHDRGQFNYSAFVKIKDGADNKIIEQKFADILNREKEVTNMSASLEPLTEMRFDSKADFLVFNQMDKRYVYIFGLIGFILLLMAGLNYINLSTALITKRVKEIGIKKVIGANYHHIFSQLLLETFLMSIIAFGLSLAWVQPFMPVLGKFTNLPLTLSLFDANIWGILIGIVGISVCVAGIYPAWLLAGFQPLQL